MIDEDSLAGCVNTYFQEQSRQGVTQSTGHNTGFVGNGNVFFYSIRFMAAVGMMHGTTYSILSKDFMAPPSQQKPPIGLRNFLKPIYEHLG